VRTVADAGLGAARRLRRPLHAYLRRSPERSSMTCDAIIIGGGPAGAATAILLAQAGWSVVVVEKRRFPRRKVCGEFLSASNATLLDRLGIADAYRAAAGPQIRRIAVFAGAASIAAGAPRGWAGSAGWGRALGRETFDAL